MAAKNGDKLRIAMIGHKRIPSREGGVEIVVKELSCEMVKRNHKVVCYNRGGHHVSGQQYDKGKLKEYCGVTLKTVPTINKKGFAAITSSFFAAIRAAFSRYDIVHFHAEGPCAMLWIPKLFGKRCIATVHGLDHQRSKWGGFASKYILFGEKCAVKYADEIIVLSKNVEQYFLDTYKRKTVFIPNGIDKPEIEKAENITEKFGLHKDEYILFLGRLVPEKGLTYLVEAFKAVNAEKKLVIAGGSSDTDEFKKELEELAKEDERIIFTGFVEGKTLSELYSNAYIYTLPSDLEGMPISLLEAMSYGNCTLTSDIPECAEVVEGFGVTFRKGDVTNLKEKLQYLCDNPEVVKAYADKSSDFICSKYSWQDVVSKTLALYGVKDRGITNVEEINNESFAHK